MPIAPKPGTGDLDVAKLLSENHDERRLGVRCC